MRRVLLVGVVLALLPLAACSHVNIQNDKWPNGMWVYPHFVPPTIDNPDTPEPNDGWTLATCIVGMNELAEGTVEAWIQDPYGIDVEIWSEWFYKDFIHGIPDRNECINAWPDIAPTLHHNYACGAALVPYWGAGGLGDMGFFRLHYLCDANGYAYFPCGPDCGLGLGLAATENTTLTEAQQAVAYGGVLDPTGQYIVDPNDPYPVQPIVCTPDPRDTRMCLEMESQ